MATYKVYITQNISQPEKAYVGMTKKEGEKLEKYFGSDKDLIKDTKTLGTKNFCKTILGTFDNWQECHYWEGFYVRTLKTHTSHGGYNKTWDGGNYIINKTPPNLGRKMSEESKNKIRISISGTHLPEEQKQKISLSLKGRKRDPEIGKKISKSKTGTKMSEEARIKNRSWKRPPQSFGNIDKSVCPHCHRPFNKGNYRRWHGDNCKKNIKNK